MGKEIERKFLVHPRKWSDLGPGLEIWQGYLSASKQCSVRVRTYGDKAYVAIKGSTKDITRDEYEYEIPLNDANEMLANLCEHPPIEKKRYRIVFKGHTWEVDEYSGANGGLTVAEVELNDPKETVELPDWIDREVSGDERYFNSNLSIKPFSTWK
jgi:adenylate cyclase